MADVTKKASQLFLQNSLPEVIKRMRVTDKPEAEFISSCIEDIKKELTSMVQSVKVTAVSKACYFSMLGYDASYASFNMVEAMADEIFDNKRIGYVAACLCFTPDNEMITLITELLKKDMNSQNKYEVGLALYFIASICTPELAKGVFSSVLNLLSHPMTYVRKKAVLSIYKIFLQYPDSLSDSLPKLTGKLAEDNSNYDIDPVVRGSVISVLCELCRRNPAKFSTLSKRFCGMLSTVQSNWTLIKLIKIFGYFFTVEPRLEKKLITPLSNLINSTTAKSVLFECVLAVATGMNSISPLTTLAVEKMKLFVEDHDPNIKYLGLDAMSRIMKSHPQVLYDQRNSVNRCLTNEDVTIRSKALEVLKGITCKGNIVSTINYMFQGCTNISFDEDWTNLLIGTIIETARTDDYKLIQDFEWYLGIVLNLSLINITKFQFGHLIEEEIVTILSRVSGVRQFGIEVLSQMLCNSNLLGCDARQSSQWKVIKAAAFACGEYPYWLTNKKEICEFLLSERILALPEEAQVACVAAVGKIASYIYEPCARHAEPEENGDEPTIRPEDPVSYETIQNIIMPEVNPEGDEEGNLKGLPLFLYSAYATVQECASLVKHQITENPSVGPKLYQEEILAVAKGAQSALELPEGLNLDESFCGEYMSLLAGSDSQSEEEDGMDEYDMDLQYKIEIQKQLDEVRRSEMSAFYIKDGSESKHGISKDEEVSKDDTQIRSPLAVPLKLKRPKKVHSISRELLKPANYVPKSPTRTRSKSSEEDEATQKLKSVDVSNAFLMEKRQKDDAAFSKLLQSTSHRHVEEPAKVDASAPLPALVYETGNLKLQIFVGRCRIKKSNPRFDITVKIQNTSATHSLNDITLSLAKDTEDYLSNVATLSAVEVDEAAPSEEGSIVFKKLKPATFEKMICYLSLSEMPQTLSEPLKFVMKFSQEKKEKKRSFDFFLNYTFFTQVPEEAMNYKKVQQILKEPLAEASVLRAFVPSKKIHFSSTLLAIEQNQRLIPVDVLHDCIVLYGEIHVRKSLPREKYVLAFLQTGVQDGESGVFVSIKMHHLGLGESLLQNIANAIQESH